MIKMSTSSRVSFYRHIGRLGVLLMSVAVVLFSGARALAAKPGENDPLHKMPAATVTNFSPASGPVGTLVKIKGTGLGATTDVSIGNKAAILLSASDTLVAAMVMPGAITGAVKVTAVGNITTPAGNFTVTAPQFPSVQQGPKLTDTLSRKPKGELRFKIPGQGAAVALSADGNTAIVHSTTSDVYSYLLVYKRQNSKWLVDTVLTKLLYRYNTLGGNTLTLSADGNTVVVGSDRSGFISLYRRTNGEWALTNEFNDLGAHAVSLSADGNTLVVGRNKRGTRAPEVSDGMYIYNRVGSNWVSQPVPIAPVLTSTVKQYQPTPDHYNYDENGNVIIPPAQYRTISTVQPGNRVAISADGKTIAAISYGDYGRYDPFTLSSTSMFVLKPTGWEAEATMLTTGPDVKLSADGNTLLEGGSIYVRSNGAWTLQQKLDENVIGSISADGNTVILGAGRANVYTRNNGSWTPQQSSAIQPATAGNPTLALTPDGSKAMLGMPYDATYVTTLNGYDEPLGSIAFLVEKSQVPVTPTTPALALKFTNTTATSTTVNWTNGSGAARAVFIAKAATSMPSPANETNYVANTTFGSGTQVVASGWYCVYNGTGSQTNIEGLQSGTTYRVAVIEYNGTANEQQYLSSKGSPANVTTTTVGPVAPTLAASAVVFSNTTGITTTASWTNGNGAMRAVFIAKQGNGFPAPASGVTYSANTKFAGGNQIGSTGWYCVYNGTGSSVNISNLLEGQTYRVAVIEYNGTAGTQTYLTSSGAPANVTTLLTPPTNQAVYLTFANTTGSSTTANWTNGSGVARGVFVARTTGGFPAPADNTFYSANPTFGGGAQIGTSGWYCVYNGTSNSTIIAGLASNTTYRVAVIEYNGATGTQQYLVSKGSPANVTTLQVGPVTPTASALALKFNSTTATATTATWTNGNGTARALFIRKANSGYPVPADNATYNSNGTYAVGSQIGTTGWYCVYNGTGTTATISGLDANTSYRAMVVEYNGGNGTEKYYTASGSPATVITAAGVTSFARTNPSNDLLVERSLASDDAVVANNILTPNGDGQNDTWTIRNIGLYPTNKVNVMDGRGTVVYSKQGYNNEWNGTYRGTTLTEGTYYYTIDLGNQTPMIKGFFTVVANR